MATFTRNSVTLDGQIVYPATYAIDEENNVIIIMVTPDGKKAKIALKEDHPLYADAMAAARAAIDCKKAHGVVPEKTFIGTEMKGPDWKIVFGSERTRVIFKSMPCAAYREAVKAAGFYWSPIDKSWNKKATFKAYRAAQDLHNTLWKIREGKKVPA